MHIILWGTRGSVPVSGPRFVRHGGRTTCLSVELDDTPRGGPSRILVDFGTGAAEAGRSSEGWNGAVALQTHLHWDHVQGFPFFRPLFDPGASIDLFAVERDGESLRDVLSDQMTRPTFPVGLDIAPAALRFHSIPTSGTRRFGEVEVRWVELDHPSGSTGYRFEAEGGSFVFTGDVEVRQGCRDRLVEFARGADVLVMDAQYFPAEYPSRVGWGHSTPLDAVDVALAAGVRRLVLTHHDPAHDDERLDAKLALARDAVGTNGLVVDNAYDGMTIGFGRSSRAAAA